MFDDLFEKKKYTSAIFCAQFLNDPKLLLQTLEESSNYAGYFAFYSYVFIYYHKYH